MVNQLGRSDGSPTQKQVWVDGCFVKVTVAFRERKRARVPSLSADHGKMLGFLLLLHGIMLQFTAGLKWSVNNRG